MQINIDFYRNFGGLEIRDEINGYIYSTTCDEFFYDRYYKRYLSKYKRLDIDEEDLEEYDEDDIDTDFLVLDIPEEDVKKIVYLFEVIENVLN